MKIYSRNYFFIYAYSLKMLICILDRIIKSSSFLKMKLIPNNKTLPCQLSLQTHSFSPVKSQYPWSGLPQLALQYGISQASPFQYLSHSQYTRLGTDTLVVHFPCSEQLLGQELILKKIGKIREMTSRELMTVVLSDSIPTVFARKSTFFPEKFLCTDKTQV